MRMKRNEGFSLIEVMAAVVILGIAMAAVFSTFLFQQQSYTSQVRVSEMQQNLRDALGMLSRDIRMSSYGLPQSLSIIDNEITSRFLKPVNSTSAPDEIYVLYKYDADSGYPSFPVSLNIGVATANITDTSRFAAGDRVLVTNGIAANLFRVTNVPSGTSLTLQGGALSDFSAGATLSKVRYVRYYIDSATNPFRPVLMLDKRNGQSPQPLADDIEDMQFQYSMDTNSDGAIDVTDNNVAGNASQVRQVHIWLLARTRSTEKGWTDTASRSMADHLAGVANDGYRRRKVDVTVDVRNSAF